MPQMAPLPWMFLFIMFITFIFFSASLIYFYFNPKIYFKLKNLNNYTFNWKW